MRLNTVLLAGVLAACFAFAAAGCDKEGKDYSCEEAIEAAYDDDCEMWCNYDTDYIYVDTCGWYDDDDPGNFDDNLAEDICGDTQDMAEDEDCGAEFQDLLNCIAKKGGDTCDGDCDDAAEDFGDCMDW